MGFGPDILTVKLENFANIDKVAEEAGKFDFVLADLVCHLCRLTIRTVVYILAQRDLRSAYESGKGISAKRKTAGYFKEELPVHVD